VTCARAAQQYFEWFRKDFGNDQKDVLNFVLSRLNAPMRTLVGGRAAELKIRMAPFDWTERWAFIVNR
jgi:hypothetical protein